MLKLIKYYSSLIAFSSIATGTKTESSIYDKIKYYNIIKKIYILIPFFEKVHE